MLWRLRCASLVAGSMLAALAVTGCSRSASDDDAQMESKLIGDWVEQLVAPQADGNLPEVLSLKADHTLTADAVVPVKGRAYRITLAGGWHVVGGSLVITVARTVPDVGAEPTTRNAHLIDVSTDSFAMRDDKTQAVTSEHRVNADNAALVAQVRSVPLARTDPEQGAVSPATETGERQGSTDTSATLYDKVLYVSEKDIKRVRLTLRGPTELRVVMDIDSDVPIDLVELPADLDTFDYSLRKANMLLGQWLPDDRSDQKRAAGEPTKPVGLFDEPLSKEAAYKHFDSGWSGHRAGVYSLYLDNSGDNDTPSRGDAPVHLVILSRAAR